jgi:hypothetical protein
MTEQSNPSERQLRALSAARDAEAGRSVHINVGDAEECCDRGWLQAYNRGYLLTEAGRAALRNHTL